MTFSYNVLGIFGSYKYTESDLIFFILDINMQTCIYDLMTMESVVNHKFYDEKKTLEQLQKTEFDNDIKSIRLYNFGLTSIDGISFPKNLKSLTLISNLITSLRNARLPDGLENLYMNFNKISYDELIQIKFPAGLKILEMAYNPVTTYRNVKFPENLVKLHIGGDHFYPDDMDQVQFPRCLKRLCISFREVSVTEFNKIQFPSELKTLSVAVEYESPMNGIKFPTYLESLTIFTINNSHMVPFPMNDVCVLNNLKVLSIDYHISTLDNVEFPDNLETLWLVAKGDNPLSLRYVHLPQNLKHINMHANLNNLDGVIFPKNTETISLSSCRLESIKGAQFPNNLKELWIGDNPIDFDDFCDTIFPKSLEVLNIDDCPFLDDNHPDALEYIRS